MSNETINALENYTYIPKHDPWRDFVTEMWFQHKDEVYDWTQKPVVDYDVEQYFSENKWFLKKQYKQRKANV